MNKLRKFRTKNLKQQLAESRAHHTEDQKTIALLNEALALKTILLENAENAIRLMQGSADGSLPRRNHWPFDDDSRPTGWPTI